MDSLNLRSKFPEQCPFHGLGKVVRQHQPSGTVLYHYITNCYPVLDEVIPDPDILGSLSTRGHSVLFKQCGAQVILEEHALVDSEALGLDKIPGPQNL